MKLIEVEIFLGKRQRRGVHSWASTLFGILVNSSSAITRARSLHNHVTPC
jgi:hypothetical protein